MQLPSLQRIRAFEAAVRLQSFTRAADEIGLTQGAVSQHIRALEERLCTELFTRTATGVIPTKAARELALQVRHGLRVLERAFSVQKQKGAACNASNANTGDIRLVLSVLPAFASRWLMPRLNGFQACHPEINVEMIPSAAIAALDGSDGIDMAIRYGPGEWPGLKSEKLMSEWVFPVASPGYHDGRLPSRLAELADCRLLRHVAQPWEPWFQAAGLDLEEPTQGPRFLDAGLLIEAAIAGQGIALARRSLVEADLARGRLVRLFDLSVEDIYAYFLVWNPENSRADSIKTFRVWLQGEVRMPPTP